MDELRRMLIDQHDELMSTRDELIEQVNIIEGRLTEIDLIAEAMGLEFITTMEEKR